MPEINENTQTVHATVHRAGAQLKVQRWPYPNAVLNDLQEVATLLGARSLASCERVGWTEEDHLRAAAIVMSDPEIARQYPLVSPVMSLGENAPSAVSAAEQPNDQLSLRDLVRQHGLEYLRGRPIDESGQVCYLSDACLDRDIETYRDEPDQAFRISRFYGSSTPQDAKKCFWISANTAKLASPQMVQQEAAAAGGQASAEQRFVLMAVYGRLHGDDDDTTMHVWVPAGDAAQGEAEAIFTNSIREEGGQPKGAVYCNGMDLVGTVSGCTFILEDGLHKQLQLAQLVQADRANQVERNSVAGAREQ